MLWEEVLAGSHCGKHEGASSPDEQSARGPRGTGACLALPILSTPLQEPVLSKEQPAFQYSSHVSLQASSGHMW